MINWIKNNLLAILIIVVIFIIWSYLLKSCNQSSNNTVLIHDTTIVTKYFETIKHDTVVKWYDRWFQKKSNADTIYWTKIDSLFIVKFKDHDVIISLKKSGCDLDVYALNEDKIILKEYKYKDVCKDFLITSQSNNLYVKSQFLYWDKPFIELEYRNNFGMTYRQIGIDIRSGINYNDKLYLNAGIGLMEKINPYWNIRLGWKPF